MSQAVSLFGADGARFIGMIDGLELLAAKIRYTFTANEDFQRVCHDDPGKGNQIFWGEMLARAHLTATTAILRNRHWIAAVMIAAQGKNLLSFAAAFRGLIESAADSATALRTVPRTFARDHAHILRALTGELETALIVDKLEDQLIHFLYARRLTKAERANAPPSHGARKISEYIEILEKGEVPEIIECYRILCDLTHPGASSVWMWLNPVSDFELDLATEQDASEISGFLTDYRKTFLGLLMYGFNPAIVTLNVLNYFPMTQFHVPQLLKWNLSGIKLWQNCENDLKGVRPHVRAQLMPVTPKSQPKGFNPS